MTLFSESVTLSNAQASAHLLASLLVTVTLPNWLNAG